MLALSCWGVAEVFGNTWYVATNGNDAAAGNDWTTAKVTIQAAIDIAQAGDTVLVSNGVYASGGRVAVGSLTNRIAITNAILVASVNGPALTKIVGKKTFNDSAVRCAYVGSNAVLSGFMLTNGGTRTEGYIFLDISGGGVWGAASGTVTNCIVVNCSSSGQYGGGAFGGILRNSSIIGCGSRYGGGCASGTLVNCFVIGNKAGEGGGTYGCSLDGCTLMNNMASFSGAGSGGGAYLGTLNNCVLMCNTAVSYGGGAARAMLSNCTLSANSVFYQGGAVNSCVLNNCVLSNNVSFYSPGGGGGGASGGSLTNCLITRNRSAADGGGTYESVLSNCRLLKNSGDLNGGGAWGGVIRNSVIYGNVAGDSGGGTYGSLQYNCTIVGNSAFDSGGGTYSGTQMNCIVYYNVASSGANYYDSVLNYSCSTPLSGGASNIADDPALANAEHLSPGSPCNGAGNPAFASLKDIDGENWSALPSMGCDEFQLSSVTGALAVAMTVSCTNICTGLAVDFTAAIEGHPSGHTWDFGDGTVVSNRLITSHAYATTGLFTATLTAWNPDYPGGIVATAVISVVSQMVHYVDRQNATPSWPFTTWANAATSIQDAVDAAQVAGSQVLVNDGTYDAGGRSMDGKLTNRVAVTNMLDIRSVNGPGVTIIVGAADPVATNGFRAIRCVYLGPKSRLSGFTLRNGHTHSNDSFSASQSGGGLLCDATAVASNCIFVANGAYFQGGGVAGGSLYDCLIMSNSCQKVENDGVSSAGGGGAAGANLRDCVLWANSSAQNGGGAHGGTLVSCTVTGNNAKASGGGCIYGALDMCEISGNAASGGGGGVARSKLSNCVLRANYANTGGGSLDGSLVLCIIESNTAYGGGGSSGGSLDRCYISGNTATNYGGGAMLGLLKNCLLAGNSSFFQGGGSYQASMISCTLADNFAASVGGGTYSGSATNCIVYDNTAPTNANYIFTTFRFSCTTPLPSGTGNVTSTPLFASAVNYRLANTSPCIDSGMIQSGMEGALDLDNRARINGTNVDIGAYEYYQAFAQYDSDGDGFTDQQEYYADTLPASSSSYFPKADVTKSAADALSMVIGQTSTGRLYGVYYNTNLIQSPQEWKVIPPEQSGNGAVITFTITNTYPAASFRTGVRLP